MEVIEEGIIKSPFTGMPAIVHYKSWLTRYGLMDRKHSLLLLVNPVSNLPIGNEHLTEYIDLNSYRQGKPMHYLISNQVESHKEFPMTKKERKQIEKELRDREKSLAKINERLLKIRGLI